MAQPLTASKLLLVADQRPTAGDSASSRVRRYRLARLRLEGRASDPALRFDHLKRVYE